MLISSPGIGATRDGAGVGGGRWVGAGVGVNEH